MTSTKQAVQSSVACDQRNVTPTQAFHEEIEAFYSNNHSPTEVTRRADAFGRVERSITSRQWKDYHVEVHRYGSFAVGAYLRSSDIDVVVVIQHKLALDEPFIPFTHLMDIQNHMEKRFRSEISITRKLIPAELPVLKVVDVATGISVDISCVSSTADHDGIRFSDWIRSRMPDYPNLTKITIAVKELLRRLGMNNVDSCGVSSYCLTLMVLGFLQQNDKGNDNLGDLLLKFLKWYAKDFDAQKYGIFVAGSGKLVSLEDIGKELEIPLYIQDPIDSTKNAAEKSSKGILPVKAAFALMYFRLKQLTKDSEHSISVKTNFLHTVFEI